MDLAVRCSRKAVKLNHSLTHSLAELMPRMIPKKVPHSLEMGNDTLGSYTLQWRHNGHDSISNHQPYECLLSRLIRQRSKKTSKLHVTGLCAGNSPEAGEFPAQRASNVENVPFDDVIMDNDILASDEGLKGYDCLLNTSIIIWVFTSLLSGWPP